jgi:hypothetical protein
MPLSSDKKDKVRAEGLLYKGSLKFDVSRLA